MLAKLKLLAIIEWYRRQMKLMNIDIKFNYEVKDISILDNFDEVIVATGATARILRQLLF